MTLDETYERTLEAIPKQKRQHAHRLFQCLVAAIRPLRVEELAEIFAIRFDESTATNLMEGWRPENPEEAILSACSTLIAVIEDENGFKIVQFSHFSVKEFLTSDRLYASEVVNLRYFHIPQDSAHYILARACLTTLLQLDEKFDERHLATFPLAVYAAQHWFVHAKYEGVAPQFQDAMEQLFNPTKPYLSAWVRMHDVDSYRRWPLYSIDRRADHPSLPKATALYYAVLCGLCGPAKYLISTHGEDVNARCGTHGTPLHAAARKGHLDAVSLLLDRGADVNILNWSKRTPLCAAYDGRHVEAMRLLLERGAVVRWDDGVGLLTHKASFHGQVEVLRLLLQHNADVDATDSLNHTPLHWASVEGHVVVAQILLKHGADINAVSNLGTALFLASFWGKLEVARLLLEHGADVHTRVPGKSTPFQVATLHGRTEIVQLLSEHGADKE
jgi:ankyrin repeat protein